MKRMQKYFLAIVPDGVVQANCLEVKKLIKEKFNIKYGLKSPAHITLKMPFSYNEAKETQLICMLEQFLSRIAPFSVYVGGVGTFGRRVIFLKVAGNEALLSMQEELRGFCKRELKLVDELSDRNFQPHMTIAFKDLKEQAIVPILNLLDQMSIQEEFKVDHIHLLKRMEGRWLSCTRISFG